MSVSWTNTVGCWIWSQSPLGGHLTWAANPKNIWNICGLRLNYQIIINCLSPGMVFIGFLFCFVLFCFSFLLLAGFHKWFIMQTRLKIFIKYIAWGCYLLLCLLVSRNVKWTAKGCISTICIFSSMLNFHLASCYSISTFNLPWANQSVVTHYVLLTSLFQWIGGKHFLQTNPRQPSSVNHTIWATGLSTVRGK